MAKAKAKKPTKEEPPQQTSKLTDPKALHELLDLHGPYEPPTPPIPTKCYVTF